MKRILLTIVTFTILFAKTSISADLPAVENNYKNILTDGQELYFKITYGIICCVRGKMVISNTDHTFAGKEAKRIEFQAFTSNLVGFFAKINNYYQSYVDKDTFLPYYFSESVHENSFKRNRYTIFDRQRNQAITDDATYKIDNASFDFLSLFTYTRTLDFDKYQPNTIIGNAEYVYYKNPTNVRILYLGKETIHSKLDKDKDIECYKIAPIMPDETIFTDKAKTILWISADNQRLPIKIQTAISWGVVNVNLTEVKNINI